MSQASAASQTASDYITSQLKLEADAREALPYQFDSCTKPLGPLRQLVFACLTCTPPPASSHQQFTPAGVCYSCCISCHGEHTLVELFTKRDFVCDCGTTRLNNSSTPCSLRLNPQTSRKGDVHGEEARQGNSYNQNYKGKFCGCGEEYDPEKEKGTMFQCLGLGTTEDGGCGEDWWHPECLMGLSRAKHGNHSQSRSQTNGALPTLHEVTVDLERKAPDDDAPSNDHVNEEPPLPLGFPDEDDFDHLVCYKCTNAFPWIKQYAGAKGFLPGVPYSQLVPTIHGVNAGRSVMPNSDASDNKKRKAESESDDSQEHKRAKSEETNIVEEAPATEVNGQTALHEMLNRAPSGPISLFLREDFRDHLCRCPQCFPRIAQHPQLLDEESSYEPPLSESDAQSEHNSIAGRSVNSGSLLERGEAALSSMDRVRAIEGVMAYNHVRDKVKTFLQPFAESGQAVGAEDIKEYFAKLRGDEQALRETAMGAAGGDRSDTDHRKEQGGY